MHCTVCEKLETMLNAGCQLRKDVEYKSYNACVGRRGGVLSWPTGRISRPGKSSKSVQCAITGPCLHMRQRPVPYCTDSEHLPQAFQMTVPEIIIASAYLSNARHVGLLFGLYWQGMHT